MSRWALGAELPPLHIPRVLPAAGPGEDQLLTGVLEQASTDARPRLTLLSCRPGDSAFAGDPSECAAEAPVDLRPPASAGHSYFATCTGLAALPGGLPGFLVLYGLEWLLAAPGRGGRPAFHPLRTLEQNCSTASLACWAWAAEPCAAGRPLLVGTCQDGTLRRWALDLTGAGELLAPGRHPAAVVQGGVLFGYGSATVQARALQRAAASH